MGPRLPDRLRRLAEPLSAHWLAAQRWFRRKSEGVARVELADAVPLGSDQDSVAGWLLVLAATSPTGAQDRYLVPAVETTEGFREPGDGEGVWRRLTGQVAAGGELRSEVGRFRFRPEAELGGVLPGGGATPAELAERRLTVEQSNTSVVIGDRLILKVYRLLEPGRNPEVEMTQFLTAAGFEGAPRLGGIGEYLAEDNAPSPAMILQEFVESESDAWTWVQRCLSRRVAGATDAMTGLAQIGTLTRELHMALASRPEVDQFPARSATPEELAGWRIRAETEFDGALSTLAGEHRARLKAVAPRIRERLAARRATANAVMTRVHGDYHLGQLLRTPTGFKVIDFGGEPARPLAERLEPGSPLRDVAGMLRSIDYAAQVAHRAGEIAEPNAWAREARAAFLEAYSAGSTLDLDLLGAFEIEKACYEVRYEANNRPDWVWLPISALERLAAGG
jgi:trehalose synthase-fused probable maltokinase